MGKDFSISMLARKLAKSAGAVVDAKLEGIIRARFNIIIHKIVLIFLLATAGGLLANDSPIVVGHKCNRRPRT